MYPIYKTVRTVGRNSKCFIEEQIPFYMSCATCGKFMSGDEIDYKSKVEEARRRYDNRIKDIQDQFEYQTSHIEEINTNRQEKGERLLTKLELEQLKDSLLSEENIHQYIFNLIDEYIQKEKGKDMVYNVNHA